MALGLGPEGTLKFFAGAADLDSWENRDGVAAGTREDRGKRMELLGTLEKQLGTTLATVSRSDSEGMEAWKERQLQALADAWIKANPDHGSSRFVITGEINGAAYDANSRVKGLKGGG
ncbi:MULTISPECIES: hypothetical protein [unclassified Streptomyces]|uniref:hypothetical protein n=1 Tax=unclassified Streptomyces TaxID=2593676 RepID=UPI00081E1CF7|nr:MULTISPECIES: hypothetical protein [unclassified Streptomyces]SCD99318.1 hypothetical protein GA0115243_105637 [Streptomyces sp. ScaeMP-e83]